MPPPPSSSTQYSTLFSDLTPITLPPPSETARTELASIAYPPKYAEATSYLRAVMAANEFSQRAVELTEDVIEMNPAHYTVWLYRMKCLRKLWGFGDGKAGVDEKVVNGVEEELRWLDGVSERNLKNYQIWHHRQSLVSLLPHLPDSEPSFITHILSFDTKNYHVWSYRQWLCTHFPSPLLTLLEPSDPSSASIELLAINTMIDQDIRNNSAWHHRYFICFGAAELIAVEQNGGDRKDWFDKLAKSDDPSLEKAVVTREVEYTKSKIRLAPQNPSPWNYLRGVLKRANISLTESREFCEEFIGVDGDVWTKHEPNGEKMGVRSSHAIDWLSEIYHEMGRGERSKDCLRALMELWDPVRRGYWILKGRGWGFDMDEEESHRGKEVRWDEGTAAVEAVGA